MTTFHSRRPLVALLLLFVFLALFYNVSTPLFEAPDEYDHFRYANWLATGHGLPDLVADRPHVGEIWQPPLYYALVALLIAPLDTSDLPVVAPFNPHWAQGVGQIAHYHTAAEAFPYHQTTLAVHLARFLSTLMGVVTIASTYQIARQLRPRYALISAALLALNPQFISLSAAVNNDNLVIALSSLTLWLLVRPREITSPSWRPYLLLGGLWGLATLAKLTGLALGGIIGLSLALTAWQTRSWRPFLFGGLVTGLTAALVAGWWFARNWFLYGEPLAWTLYLEITQGLLRPQLLSWPATLRYASFLHKSYWAVFGYGVLAPGLFYAFTDLLMGLAALGLGRWLIQARRKPALAACLRSNGQTILLLSAAWGCLVFALLLRWMRQIEATNHGRLLFPAASALTIWLAVGLYHLASRRRWLGKGAVAILGTWAAAMPFLVLQPTYARPKPLNSAAVIPHPTSIIFGEGVELTGYDLPDPDVRPGDRLELALYWRASQPIHDDLMVAIRLLDANEQVVSSLDTVPYQARFPTVTWPAGVHFRDVYQLPPVSAAATPGLATLLVILYPIGRPDAPLSVTTGADPTGSDVRLTTLKISPSEPLRYEPPRQVEAVFNRQYRLMGFAVSGTPVAGRPLTITLYWEGLQPDGRTYTVFVHLLDATGQLITQADSPPQNGRYPTSLWAVGEQVLDAHTAVLPAALPPAPYSIRVGLYDPVSGQRLPAVQGNGAPWPNDGVLFTIP
ncbi:MAG: glycosyltransferase family 39 protein [Chloroflexota bacterium]